MADGTKSEEKNKDWFGLDSERDSEGESEGYDSDAQNESKGSKGKSISCTSKHKASESENESGDQLSEEEKEEDDDDLEEDAQTKDEGQQGRRKRRKVAPATQEEALKMQKKIEKSGVVYISRVPPYMRPEKMRQILSRFGKIGRIFLAPENQKAYAQRVKSGGNKKRSFTEGWAEFKNKKYAKLAAETLNNRIIGGRKGSFYYDDILNVQYLPKFKWHHLTEQIAAETQAMQSKLRAEISQTTRENKIFIRNVERAKTIEKIQEKRKSKLAKQSQHDNNTTQAGPSSSSSAQVEQQQQKVRRSFKQRQALEYSDKEPKPIENFTLSKNLI